MVILNKFDLKFNTKIWSYRWLHPKQCSSNRIWWLLLLFDLPDCNHEVWTNPFAGIQLYHRIEVLRPRQSLQIKSKWIVIEVFVLRCFEQWIKGMTEIWKMLTFRGIECIFGVWIDFDKKGIFLDEKVVHIEKSFGNLFGNIAQAKLFSDFNCLLFRQTLYNINWFVKNGIWIFSSDFFNVNTTLWRCNNDWTLNRFCWKGLIFCSEHVWYENGLH